MTDISEFCFNLALMHSSLANLNTCGGSKEIRSDRFVNIDRRESCKTVFMSEG